MESKELSHYEYVRYFRPDTKVNTNLATRATSNLKATTNINSYTNPKVNYTSSKKYWMYSSACDLTHYECMSLEARILIG
jgi:hypothetical protein